MEKKQTSEKEKQDDFLLPIYQFFIQKIDTVAYTTVLQLRLSYELT